MLEARPKVDYLINGRNVNASVTLCELKITKNRLALPVGVQLKSMLS
jgi:hypothetical protein